MSHRDVTVRDGTSEKYWYTLAGYVALVLVGLVGSVWTLLQFQSAEATVAGGFTVAIFALVLSGLGLVTYPALFKDSAYVRATSRRWEPQWWYYIGFGVGVPILVYAVASVAGAGSVGGVLALYGHAVSAGVMSASYLYQRHQYIGVP